MGLKSETDTGLNQLNEKMNHTKLKELFNNKETAPTFSFDTLLPPLPLPSLDYTLTKYLESVKPFLTDIEYLNTQRLVENFRNGIGKHLNFHLSEKAKKERNWVSFEI
jgi:hypothetical protein